MQYVRFRDPAGSIRNGILEGNLVKFSNVSYQLDEIDLLAPVEPSKIICVGKNYADHAKSMDVILDKIKKYRTGRKVRLSNQQPKPAGRNRRGKPADTSTHFTRRTPLRPDETETHEERDGRNSDSKTPKNMKSD